MGGQVWIQLGRQLAANSDTALCSSLYFSEEQCFIKHTLYKLEYGTFHQHPHFMPNFYLPTFKLIHLHPYFNEIN